MGERLGAGREAEVHAWGEAAVIKLYRPGFGGYPREAAVLAGLDGRGIAPRLVDTVRHDGRTGLVLERLDGPDMLVAMRQRPLRMPALAGALARAHLAVHEVRAPAELPELREALAARIGAATMPGTLRDHALRVLDTLPGGDRLCHGDYHPGNVIVTADRIAVIDWPNASRGVPEADHARTMLLLRWGDAVPGTPLLERALIGTVRRSFARRYAQAYRRGSPVPPRRTAAWLVVHAAARLAEGIEVERPMLLGLLDRARGDAAR